MTREARKPRRPGQQFKKRKPRPCVFCIDKNSLDYKDSAFVRRFMTDRGKIAPRRNSGCCAFHQRMVARAIKRARQLGLVSFVLD
jgi:small subunit ribosomal protein S18